MITVIESIPEHPLYQELYEGVLDGHGRSLAERNPWHFLALADKIYQDLFNDYTSIKDKNEKLRLSCEIAGLAAISLSVQ